MKRNEEEKMYKLKKVLYQLKEPSRAWYSNIDGIFFSKRCFKKNSEPTIYVNKKGMSLIFIVIL